MKATEQVSQLINCLTKDEDKRQELWVHYLSGHSPSSFASHLEKIDREYAVDQELQSKFHDILEHPPSDKFQELLSHLSSVECSIVCLLALGCDVHDLSRYKGISDIRIRQVISIIKEHDCWEKVYAKETADRRGKIRVR